MKTLAEMSIIVEALSSCAIEGNAEAAKLLALRYSDPEAFAALIEKLFPEEKKDE